MGYHVGKQGIAGNVKGTPKTNPPSVGTTDKIICHRRQKLKQGMTRGQGHFVGLQRIPIETIKRREFGLFWFHWPPNWFGQNRLNGSCRPLFYWHQVAPLVSIHRAKFAFRLAKAAVCSAVAHSFQMRTPLSCKYWTWVSPFKNQSSS